LFKIDVYILYHKQFRRKVVPSGITDIRKRWRYTWKWITILRDRIILVYQLQ